MTIFLNNIKRIFKDKMAMFFMIIMPVVFMAVVYQGNMDGGSINLGIVDNDNSKLTAIFKDNIKNGNKINIIDINESDIKSKLTSTTIDYAIVIDKGFTSDLISGKDVKLKSYSINSSNIHLPVKMYAENFLNAAKNISKASKGNETQFYKGMEYYKNGSFISSSKSLDNHQAEKNKSRGALGFLIMGVFSIATFGYSFTVEDKESKIYYRIFTTPITLKKYMMENILTLLSVSFIQILLLLSILKFGFKAYLGASFFNMFVVIFVFSLSCVALAVLLDSVSKTSRQLGVIGTLIFTPFCMLGGCFWPIEIMPKPLKQISNFIPTTWALKAAEKILYDKVLSDVYMEISIMLLFALVFFLLSSWKKADISV